MPDVEAANAGPATKGLKPFGRGVALAAATLGALVVGAAAAAQEIPELRVAESFAAAPFSVVRGVRAVGGGRVLVSDQREVAVWVVDFARATRQQVGREGSGPGEYRNPIRILPFRGDSLILEDLGNGRLVVLDSGLHMGRTMPMFEVVGTIIGGTDRVGRFYVDGVATVRLDRARDPSAGDRAPLARVDPERGGVADTITTLRVPGPPNPPPWPEWDGWAVGSDGRVLVVRNQDEYRVEWFFPDGRQRSGPRLDGSRLSVTAEDRRMWSEGRGWIGRLQHQAEIRALFDVVGPDGRRIAQVRLPPRRRVVGFGPNSLYAVYTDDVDFQWLERFDIRDLP
ncbi:MAG: hypothetical protein AMXMBFR53_35260 [Gemmatimonadota bacterium]